MIGTQMLRAFPSTWLLLALVVGSVACGAQRSNQVLNPDDAAAALRGSPAFTTRAGSIVSRELIEVVAVRRIGNSSTEVEFTWRDSAPPAGEAHAPVRTSMALFRMREPGVWVLSSLYKVN